MTDTVNVFAVLDPTCMEQVTLDWAEAIVRNYKVHRSIDAVLHVYCCINDGCVALVPADDPAEGQRATIARVKNWMERLVSRAAAEGMKVETEVEWNSEWRKAIVAAAVRQRSALVVKNMARHARIVRLTRETADWRLLRDCQCPVLLVKDGRPYSIKRVLVAVKHRPDDAAYERANDQILAAARSIAEDLGADLHAVTCLDARTSIDRQRFADRCGLKRSQVIAAIGVPEGVIADAARTSGADLVILARVARPESASVLGDTTRKVIDEIDTEVLVLPMS